MADPTESRAPLTTERVISAAVDLADRSGVDALTMRAIGAELGVTAMSLYKHVADKDAILDGIVEHVVSAIAVPDGADDWRDGLRLRARSSREVLTRHSWAIGLMEGRGTLGPATMRSLDATLGSLRSGGFSITDAAYVIWMLDAFVYGHVVQAAGASVAAAHVADTTAAGVTVRSLVDSAPADLHHLQALGEAAADGAFDLDDAFNVGLEGILAACEARLDPTSRPDRTD